MRTLEQVIDSLPPAERARAEARAKALINEEKRRRRQLLDVKKLPPH